jgi:hypothetical protein
MLFSNSFFFKSSGGSFDIKVAIYDPFLPLHFLRNVLKDAVARKVHYSYQTEVCVLVLLRDYFAC